MKLKNMLVACVVLLATFSCKTPQDVSYLQDIQPGITIDLQDVQYIRFQPGDKININIHSLDEQLMRLFNISNVNSNSSANTRLYSVNQNGEIDFPVLGLIKVKGMTREEVARTIKYQLISSSLCNDPVVTVEFANMRYSVLGAVNRSGEVEIDKDYITLFEAIAKAGDLNINGRRQNVLVLRKEGNKQTPYIVDLTNTSSVYSSPVFYLKQDDVVYVEPNSMLKRQTTPTGSSSHTPSFWMSIASFLASMGVLLTK